MMKMRHCRSASRWLAARGRRALPLALAFMLGSAWPAWSQAVPGSGQLAVRSDGFIFWIQDGFRHTVYPTPLSDEQINAMPEGAPLNASLVPAPPAGAPTDSTAPQPTGSSRADRLALYQPCLCYLVRGPGQRSDLVIQVTQVQREAWSSIKDTNPTNQPPRDGYEYIMVSLKIIYREGPRDLPYSADRYDFTLIDNNDTLYTPAFVFEPNALISQTIYPGSEVNGQVAYQVPREHLNDFVLVWRYNDERPVWFAIS